MTFELLLVLRCYVCVLESEHLVPGSDLRLDCLNGVLKNTLEFSGELNALSALSCGLLEFLFAQLAVVSQFGQVSLEPSFALLEVSEDLLRFLG